MFESFSEAAKLYAKNYSVIKAVRTEFEQDIDAFLDCVRDEIRLAIPEGFCEKVTPTYRYWWIGEEKHRDRFPQFWLEKTRPEIVIPGQLKLTAIAPEASSEQVQRLIAIAEKPEFNAVCKKAFGGKWSLFTAIIKYGDEEPVQCVSQITASLLTDLNRAYESRNGAAVSGE